MLKKEEINKALEEKLENGFSIWCATAKSEKGAITYFQGSTECLMIAGSWHDTLENLKKQYAETFKKDFKVGYEARKVGYYDKWYRYNRFDQGFAHDLGCKLACTKNDIATDEFHIIPCIH